MIPLLDIHTHRAEQPVGNCRIYNPLQPALPDGDEDSWLSLGVHPWSLWEERLESQLAEMEQLATDDRVKLIGECGLDRLRGPAMHVQHPAFVRHVELAVSLSKPLIVHCVRAFDELIPYGRRYAGKTPLIVHGFNRSPELGMQLMKHGFLLSFGAAVMRPDAGAAQLVSRMEPPFFLETDDSSCSIDEIYQQVAFLRNVSLDTLKDTIFAGWKKIQLI